ncbi:MAG: hypothetical protein AVDCRST_MAG39-1720, partial [uncultured Sphingomonadaceae bacterium]
GPRSAVPHPFCALLQRRAAVRRFARRPRRHAGGRGSDPRHGDGAL